MTNMAGGLDLNQGGSLVDPRATSILRHQAGLLKNGIKNGEGQLILMVFILLFLIWLLIFLCILYTVWF